jgi:hypothetical protein
MPIPLQWSHASHMRDEITYAYVYCEASSYPRHHSYEVVGDYACCRIYADGYRLWWD